jgi:predicted ATPase
MAILQVGSAACHCKLERHPVQFVVLTGGPGAGKTAVLEMACRYFCRHVGILPEAASIVFGGGFPRHSTEPGRLAAQRAIYHVQREVERLVAEEGQVAIALCDRGTLDSLAYWPGPPDAYWEQFGTTMEDELARYAAVIHMKTPLADNGYNHQNALRIESATEAERLDQLIASAWSKHPRRFTVPSMSDFLDKAAMALMLTRAELPPCCHEHPLPAGRSRS